MVYLLCKIDLAIFTEKTRSTLAGHLFVISNTVHTLFSNDLLLRRGYKYTHFIINESLISKN